MEWHERGRSCLHAAVFLRIAVSCVGYGEPTIRAGLDFDGMAVGLFVQVSDESLGDVMFCVGARGVVELPEVGQAG